MKDNAMNKPCDIIMYPNDERYSEDIRNFQGCPTIATTKNGRIFLGWYSGGTREPHIENYNLLIHSDDNGKSWTDPVMVIPSSKENLVHALDIQLWISPEGKLYVFWVQNNVGLGTDPKPECKSGQPYELVEGYQFYDFRHTEWVAVCDDPDAEKLVFSEPKCLDIGFLRCKPLVLKSGRWINFNYDQQCDKYGYSISDDNGKTYIRHYGSEKLSTLFDEAMAYEMNDGAIRMFARTRCGYLAESYSYDNGITWTQAKESGIASPNTRFYISRTPNGNILMINNDASDTRKNMTVYLSEDDGKTWKYKRCIDKRDDISYPDVDFYGGRIYLTYDRERTGAKEILFTSFTEEDIKNEDYIFDIRIVSKP